MEGIFSLASYWPRTMPMRLGQVGEVQCTHMHHRHDTPTCNIRHNVAVNSIHAYTSSRKCQVCSIAA